MPNLIIITGCPGTGKSYLANLLLERFPTLQLCSYDTVKEAFWDRWGFDSPAEKRRVNACSLWQYYADLAVRMLQKTDLLLEYPFHMGHRPALAQLAETFGYTPVTIYLHGQMDVIYRRCVRRDGGGARHPGHLHTRYHAGAAPDPSDAAASPERQAFLADCASKNYDIRLGRTISVDVTDYSAVDYGAVLDAVAAAGDWEA